MGDSQNIIEFEQLLQKRNFRKPSVLYNNIKTNEPKYKPQDVIQTVYSQIKAIQMADTRNQKSGNREKTNFLPVEKVPVYKAQQNPNKFDTQCVSDTQLINIIERAEAIDSHIGITQEFDTTFAHNDNKKCIDLEEQNNDEDDEEIDIKSQILLCNRIKPKTVKPSQEENVMQSNSKHEINDRNIVTKVKTGLAKNTNNDDKKSEFSHKTSLLSLSGRSKTNSIGSPSILFDNTQQFDTLSGHTPNLPIDGESHKRQEVYDNIVVEEEVDIDTGQKTQRSPSPVLKPVDKKRRTPSPLVVSLESFEKFEKIAMPILEENPDTERAKHLINSQILGKELVLNTDKDIFGFEGKYSPVLELKSDELKLNSEDLMQMSKATIDALSLKDSTNMLEKTSDVLEDEILFSSDEELESFQNEVHDLPLTCALESQLYENSGILNNTMYVGFQTASNRSIQISTCSFDKAKHILDENNETVNEFSLTELVEKYVSISSANKESISESAALDKEPNRDFELKAVASDLISPRNVIDVESMNIKENELQRCDKVINNAPSMPLIKIIMPESSEKMSDKALERCQKVFKDIDVNENFDANENTLKTVSLEDKNLKDFGEHYRERDNNVKVDEIFHDNINDELLLEEFGNIEMSLEEKENNELKMNTSESVRKFDLATADVAISNKKNTQIHRNTEKNSIDADIYLKGNLSNYQLAIKEFYLNNEIGFKTANNKTISISATALVKSKNIFEDIGLKINFNDNGDESGSKLEEKSAELKPARDEDMKIFDDDNIIISQKLFVDMFDDEVQKKSFNGFKTASNKDIAVSEQALAKTKKLFEDIDINPDNIISKSEQNEKCDNVKLDTPSNQKSTEFVGFKTANDKAITISDTAFSKSKDIFKDLDKVVPKHLKAKPDVTDYEEEREDHDNYHTIIEFTGFKTANNKEIKISDDALIKTKKIFQDIAQENIELERGNNKSGFEGFKTASNKNVNVSEQALQKSMKLLKDVDIAHDANDKPEKSETFNDDIYPFEKVDRIEKPKFLGFQTASKKPVSVSDEALAKSKRLLQDIDRIDEFPKENSNYNFEGLQKAKFKITGPDNEALFLTKNCSEFKNRAEINTNAVVGFKTASHKNVTISDVALAKCKKIFENIDLESNTDLHGPNSEILPSKNAFKGFQTASNQKVEISEDAIQKTKNIFDDISFTKKGSEFGFQTANNKKETVSEESLRKSRQIFHYEDSEIGKNNTARVKKITEDVKTNKCTANMVKKRADKIFEALEDQETSNKKIVPNANLLNDKLNTKPHTTSMKNDNILIDTQILNNFDMSLHTKDFIETPRPNKRSGSPILSCPKAKTRKKFETPYKTSPQTINFDKVDKNLKRKDNIIKFRDDYKKTKKYTLKDLHFERDKNVDPYILGFNLENLLAFEYSGTRNDMTEGVITIDDLKNVFIDATNKKLIPEGWLENHLKLILWKLISYEIKCPRSLGIVCTAKNVIEQLKYRYDRELYNAERPILRKILEKDDVSTNTMVLCVAGIYIDDVSVASVTNTTNIELQLTDGWYFIRATIDKMLAKLVYDEKIVVGSKIVTEGAELMNCDQGVAPWEDTSSVRLTISGNSTRPARWDAKLGLRPDRLRSTLASVKPEGGRVRCLRVLVTRLYPLLYVEKFEDGSTVTRSERLEHLHQMKYEAEREIMIEKIYEEVEKEFSDQESQDSEEIYDSNKRKGYESGSQIAKVMKKCRDPMEFRAQLTASQVHQLQEHTNKKRDRYLQEIQDRVRNKLKERSVVTLARARIVGVHDQNKVTKGTLSIWKPNDAVLEILKEGSWIEIINVVPTGYRNSEIQISAGRQSVFRTIKSNDDKTMEPYLQALKRTCYNIKDLSQNPSMTTEYNEIDTVGFIFSIEPSCQDFESNKNQFQNLYLADADKNMICVNFWGGIKKFGFENVLDTAQVIFCANLQKRSGNTRRNVPQYRATEFSTFTKSPKNDKARGLVEELGKKLFGLDRRKFCEDCIAIKQNYSVLKCFNDSENVSPYRFHNNSAYNLVKNKVYIETPKGMTKAKKDDFDLSGLDFESTFKQTDTQELSPKTLLRKKQVQQKIARLKMYGEPPPLSPINIKNISKNATNSYKSPLQSNRDCAATTNKPSDTITDDSNSTTPKKPNEKNAHDKGDSPVISMNKTYVKRVNPVKLNFSEKVVLSQSDSIDHFAEEFDGSPPLSLE